MLCPTIIHVLNHYKSPFKNDLVYLSAVDNISHRFRRIIGVNTIKLSHLKHIPNRLCIQVIALMPTTAHLIADACRGAFGSTFLFRNLEYGNKQYIHRLLLFTVIFVNGIMKSVNKSASMRLVWFHVVAFSPFIP